jgi:hypothetical protein
MAKGETVNPETLRGQITKSPRKLLTRSQRYQYAAENNAGESRNPSEPSARQKERVCAILRSRDSQKEII